ncbi:hypothetical protein SUGI_0970150 [Cryptomeria japonica]|nr:hypothetical protein SUGI_0970150 [Cryptomeria japonica]
MAAAGDPEKGAVMDPSPGERKEKALTKKAEERVISHLLKLLAHFGLYGFFCREGKSGKSMARDKEDLGSSRRHSVLQYRCHHHYVKNRWKS